MSASPSAAPRAHPAEWVLVGLEGLLLAALAWRYGHPDFLRGQLLPSLAVGLAPGCALRLIGRASWSAHRFGVAAALFAFMIANGTLRLDALRQAAGRWPLVLLSFVAVWGQPLLGALRWRILLAAQEVPVRYAEALRLGLVGMFFNLFVPGHTGGDIFRAYAVAADRRRTDAAILSVLLDRLLGLPPLLLIVAFGCAVNLDLFATPTFRPFGRLLAGGLAACVLLLALLLWPSRRAAPAASASGWMTQVRLALHAFRRNPRAIGLALLLGFGGHLATLAACVAAGVAVGVEGIEPLRYLLLVPMGLAVNAIPAAPGGVGQGEMAFATLFAAASGLAADGSRGAAVMLCLRVGQILCGAAGGVLYALGRHRLSFPVESAPCPPAN